MGKFDERALLLLAVCVLAAHTPAEAWYKQAAGPTYYSVGRASGLLAGIRRSAIRREEADTGDSGEATENHAVLLTNSRNFALKSMQFNGTKENVYLFSLQFGNLYLLPKGINSILFVKDLPICVKDILPELQSCELIQDSMFRCEAAVIITLDSRNCVNA